jgi:hypothetical protein
MTESQHSVTPCLYVSLILQILTQSQSSTSSTSTGAAAFRYDVQRRWKQFKYWDLERKRREPHSYDFTGMDQIRKAVARGDATILDGEHLMEQSLRVGRPTQRMFKQLLDVVTAAARRGAIHGADLATSADSERIFHWMRAEVVHGRSPRPVVYASDSTRRSADGECSKRQISPEPWPQLSPEPRMVPNARGSLTRIARGSAPAGARTYASWMPPRGWRPAA